MDQLELTHPLSQSGGADMEDSSNKCEFNPEFAVICSFIAQFGDKIDLQLNIERLKLGLEEQSKLDESLIDLHVKLLKKIRRYFVRDQWEKALLAFTSEYSYEDAYEIQQVGYQNCSPSIKLRLLRRLLEAQFECDPKFKAAVNLSEPMELRLPPTGRDINGNTYWHRVDSEGNFRIFREQPLDHQSWETVCSNPQELSNLIEELDKCKDARPKGEPIKEPYNPLPKIFPEYFTKEEGEEREEDKTNGDEEKQVTTKTSRGKKNVRGRGKGAKKTSPLACVKEATEKETEVNTEINCNNLSKIHDTNGNDFKIKTEQQITSNGTHLPSPYDSGQISIESQVKWTLESIVSRVVSSFEYMIRPLSRNSNNPKDEKEVNDRKPARKRQAARREKLNEEPVPRRTSSRIQQLQQKKTVEQEEVLKKMIESKANKKSNSTSSHDDDPKSRGLSFKNGKRRSESPENGKNSRKRRKGGRSWQPGKKKKKKLSWDKDDSDLSSTSSLTESNEDEFEDAGFEFGLNEDDEFACEEEDTNIEPVIIKRARTARQTIETDQVDPNTSSIIEEDKPCGRCDKSNDPEWILLCDMCDDGYHTSCCLPPLMMVPDGNWYCPSCEHKMLLEEFRSLYTTITQLLEAKELERIKRQKLRTINVRKEPIKSQVSEVVPEKRQRFVLEELADPIALQQLDEDLGEELGEIEYSSSGEERSRPRPKKTSRSKKTKRRPRCDYDDDEEYEEDFSINYKKTRKTYSRRNYSDSEDEESEDELLEMQSASSDEEVKPKARRARASVSYRFQEYDELIKSATQDSYDEDEGDREKGEEGDDDDDEDKEESESEEECTYGRGKDMATIEALAYQQENGLPTCLDGQEPAPVLTELTSRPTNNCQKKPRKKSRRLNDLDAVSETEDASDESFQASSATEADEDDDDLTEAESYDSETSIDELVESAHWGKSRKKNKKVKRRSSYESDDSDYRPNRTRRVAAAKVSYKESSDEDDIGPREIAKKAKRNVLSSDEESEASWRSAGNSEVDEGANEEANKVHEVTNKALESTNKVYEVVPLVADQNNLPVHPPFYENGEP